MFWEHLLGNAMLQVRCLIAVLNFVILNSFVIFFVDGCGVCKDMTSAGGTIESPNYPDNYSPDLNCMFTINSPSQTIIQLTFTDFSVEQCCDFVSVSSE